ncbi:hypothetical protein TNCV_4634061 [Trichonephila clavipes]|nr:hypothetical protein TNCV_4634061 [Trichonephila clavipes]
MCDKLRFRAATKRTFHHFQHRSEFSNDAYVDTDGLFNGLLCKAVSTSATFVFIMNALPDHFLSATESVSLNRCTKSVKTDTAGSDVVQSGRPIFDDFFQHLWPYIGNNTANVVFQMVKRLWLIRIDQ